MRDGEFEENSFRRNIVIFLAFFIIICLLILVFKVNGYAILSDRQAVVYRTITEDATTVYVNLSISSYKNVIMIQEFLSENCVILNPSGSEEYQDFQFDPSENSWIISDPSKQVNLDISYEMTKGCRVINGSFSYLNGNDTVEETIFSDEEDLGSIDPSKDDVVSGGEESRIVSFFKSIFSRETESAGFEGIATASPVKESIFVGLGDIVDRSFSFVAEKIDSVFGGVSSENARLIAKIVIGFAFVFVIIILLLLVFVFSRLRRERKLNNWIDSGLKRGYSKIQLRDYLLSHKLDVDEVERALNKF